MDKRHTVCNDCYAVFLGGPNAFLCPECRRKRLSEIAKKINLNKLGNEAYSKQQAKRKAVVNDD